MEVGLGFFLELTLDEASAHADKKVKELESRAEALSEQACQIKANIKLVLEGLRELQGIAAEDLVAQRDRRRDLLQ